MAAPSGRLMGLVEVSRFIAEMQELREAVATYERLTRGHLKLVDERVSNCLTVTREVSHRLLVVEGRLRGE